MKQIRLIARSDDLGSSFSANKAIDAVSCAGLIKNVSVMAPGPAAAGAADMLTGRKEICFGMHMTLNAEWDQVKWAPVLPLGKNSGLIDENGNFLNDPALFAETKPDLQLVMLEVNAQLEKLHGLGFDIKYIDSHMFPEFFIPGLDEALEQFARQKGLIDHMYFYNILPGFNPEQLKTVPDGQYFIVTHPALDTAEMRKTGNAHYSGKSIAAARASEAQIFSDPETLRILDRIGCQGIRYDEAVPQKRATLKDLRKMLQRSI